MQPSYPQPCKLSSPVVLCVTLRSQVGNLPAVLLRRAVVAGDTIFIQHGLHISFKIKPSGRTVPRLDLSRRMLRGQSRLKDGNFFGALVTADAGDRFARHRREPASHKLDRFALLIQRLDAHGRIGGHIEQSRTIFVNFHRTEDPHDFPGASTADLIRPRHSRITVMVSHNSQLLNRAARNTRQSRPDVYIVDIDNSVVALQVHSVRDSRGARCLFERDRLKQVVLRHHADRQDIIENIHEVDTPRTLGIQPARDKEIFIT